MAASVKHQGELICLLWFFLPGSLSSFLLYPLESSFIYLYLCFYEMPLWFGSLELFAHILNLPFKTLSFLRAGKGPAFQITLTTAWS